MGLPVSQRRNLAEIEGSLRATDPRLVSLLEIFTRLTRDEEMPRAEHRLAADGRRRMAPSSSALNGD